MEESLVLFSTPKGYIYNRASVFQKDYKQLTEKLNGRYTGNSLLTSSGMNSISVVLNGLLINNKIDNVIYGNELYCDTPRLIEYLAKVHKFTSYPTDIEDS